MGVISASASQNCLEKAKKWAHGGEMENASQPNHGECVRAVGKKH